MEDKKDSLLHTEKGVIEILRELGYIETTSTGGIWFKGMATKLIDEQISLRFIEQECDKIYRYLERMGGDVYKLCRFIDEQPTTDHSIRHQPPSDISYRHFIAGLITGFSMCIVAFIIFLITTLLA